LTTNKESSILKRLFVWAALAVTLALVAPAQAPAATAGLAWDSVTKINLGAGASSLQPGSFPDDFAAASASQSPGGGLFSHMLNQDMMSMMHNGFAERHYVAGSKERTDQVTSQTARIVDCAARTITTLDLAKKTYRVESMDHPSAPSSGGTSGGGSAAKDDGTKVAIAIANSALGARQVNGEPTNGYSSQMTFTETKASGESQTQNASLTGYYAGFNTPGPACAGRSAINPGGMSTSQQFGMMASMAGRMMQAMRSAGLDSRFSVKQSGPALPLGGFAMFQAMTFQAGGGHAPTFITERGDVRSIAANDPIFSVPSDFTLQK
jgi:hypothetical protein